MKKIFDITTSEDGTKINFIGFAANKDEAVIKLYDYLDKLDNITVSIIKKNYCNFETIFNYESENATHTLCCQ